MTGYSSGEKLPASFDNVFNLAASSGAYDSLRLNEAECLACLSHPLARTVFGHKSDGGHNGDTITFLGTEDLVSQVGDGGISYTEFVLRNVSALLTRLCETKSNSEVTVARSRLLHIGYAALSAFLQSNVTGPPLPFSSNEVVIPELLKDRDHLRVIRQKIIRDLSVDGESVYKLTPNVELFAAAKAILTHKAILNLGTETGVLPLVVLTARLRVNFTHQKLLSENTDALQSIIYDDLDEISKRVLAHTEPAATVSRTGERARLLLERSVIHTHHGFSTKAVEDLENAARENGFEFALTGKMGKRTKFQNRDISQLVVLAKSADEVDNAVEQEPNSTSKPVSTSKPQNLDLNDDTLLESISFNDSEKNQEKAITVHDESLLPQQLAGLDPSNQPKLNPLDSIVLLSLASSITNTSPEDGLTREETLPYATRVLEGGSSNWQVYTQALLVRSRIEGYRTRTIERGVLQLQTIVDQVIADTATDSESAATLSEEQPSTFMPRPEASESAPAAERLEYIWLLNFSTRWQLEAELAARWVHLGGLRTALDIYERLQMWAEAALCYAATDREDKARLMVRKQLFQRTNPKSEEEEEEDNDKYEGPELTTLPPDAPRLFSILGDIDKDTAMYQRAWVASNGRYARAQRSLARLYLMNKPPLLKEAEKSYRLSLTINRLNHSAWFALGCVQLELEKWEDAVESFTRTVQLEESDAEAWSNLAAALINVPPKTTTSAENKGPDDDEENSGGSQQLPDPNKPKWDALTALKRAARFKHTDHRIWDNILTVTASIPPPDTPFREILQAQIRLIELRGEKDGEKCIDITVLTALVETLTSEYAAPENSVTGSSSDNPSRNARPGSLSAQLLKLIDEHVVPLITHSPALWILVAQVEKWRNRPSKALLAHEKAWRTAVASNTQGAFQMAEEKKWMEIVNATEILVRKGYAVLGGMDKEGEDGELVAKDWRFKARSAVRGILGKGREFWEDSEGWLRLKALAEEVTGNA